MCDPARLAEYVTSGFDDSSSSSSRSSSSSSSSSSKSSSSSSSSSDDEGKEFTSYSCRVPSGTSVEVLDGYTNGNDVSQVEYVWYEFDDDDCVDSNGKNDKPPCIDNSGDVDCVISIKSGRSCGFKQNNDLMTWEAANNGESLMLTSPNNPYVNYDRDGPGILFTRNVGQDCDERDTIVEVDYLCYQYDD